MSTKIQPASFVASIVVIASMMTVLILTVRFMLEPPVVCPQVEKKIEAPVKPKAPAAKTVKGAK